MLGVPERKGAERWWGVLWWQSEGVGRGAWGVGCVCCLSWWGWGESTRSLPPRCPPPTALPKSVQLRTPHAHGGEGRGGAEVRT